MILIQDKVQYTHLQETIAQCYGVDAKESIASAHVLITHGGKVFLPLFSIRTREQNQKHCRTAFVTEPSPTS